MNLTIKIKKSTELITLLSTISYSIFIEYLLDKNPDWLNYEKNCHQPKKQK